MMWPTISAVSGLITDCFLQKYFCPKIRPFTCLFSLLSCGLILSAFDAPMEIIKGCIFSQLLILAGYIDYQTREIPDSLIITIALCGLIDMRFLSSLEGAAMVFLVTLASRLISGKPGGGDIKLMAGCGFVLGLWGALYAGILCHTLLFITSIIFRKNLEGRYPFGPYVGIGCLIAYIIK